MPNAVDEQIKARLYQHWDEGEIVEMLGGISLFGYLNRWNDTMATTLEPLRAERADRIIGNSLQWQAGKHGEP